MTQAAVESKIWNKQSQTVDPGLHRHPGIHRYTVYRSRLKPISFWNSQIMHQTQEKQGKEGMTGRWYFSTSTLKFYFSILESSICSERKKHFFLWMYQWMTPVVSISCCLPLISTIASCGFCLVKYDLNLESEIISSWKEQTQPYHFDMSCSIGCMNFVIQLPMYSLMRNVQSNLQSKLLPFYCLLFYPIDATICMMVRLLYCTKNALMNEVSIIY